MGRRILAFFLGFIFAFILIFGTIFILVKVIKVEQYAPASKDYIGDLAGMSVYDIGDSIYKLYGEKVGFVDENGNYYTLQQFCDNYHINLSTALGMELPQEVLDMPAFVYFSEDGMNKAMKQIKVSTLPAIVNMFGGTNEDGTSNGAFGDDVLAELAKFSMYDLLSNEEVGFAGVFANVSFAQMLPDSFPAEDSDNKLMWAIGQAKIGKMISGIGGSDNFMLQLKEGGALEALGQVELSALLGESQYVSAVMGANAVFADLIGDDGTILFDDILGGVSVGELLGCQKNEITQIDGYNKINIQDDESDATVMQKVVGEEENAVTLYVMSVNGENWYEAELKCDLTVNENGEDHAHSIGCYKYVWYSTTECDKNHTHESSGDMLKDGIYYARTDGLYAALSGLSITDLTSGNTDALMDEIKTLKVSEIVDASDVNGVMSSLLDLTIEELMNGAIDDLYLGEFFNLHRFAVKDIASYNVENATMIPKDKDHSLPAYYLATNADGDIAMSLDKKTWYVGKLNCDVDEEDHTHGQDCYMYSWNELICEPQLGEEHTHTDDCYQQAEGIKNKLAGKQIGDLQNLNEEVLKLTLYDVFGEDKMPSMLKSIQHVEIGELSEHINTIQLGELLEYEGGLTCEIADEDHVHDYTCYTWYQLTCDNEEDGHEHDDSCRKLVEGMMAKLACKQVDEMRDLTDTIKSFTLKDVLGDDVPSMLKALENTEIGDLDTAINEMHLGDFLEYKRSQADNVDEANKIEIYKSEGSTEVAFYVAPYGSNAIALSIDGETWYEGVQYCTNRASDHTHVASCYGYVWLRLNCDEASEGHEHDENCYEQVTGMMAKLADKTVNELKYMDEIVQSFTLRDVLGDNVPAMLQDVADETVGNVGNAIENIYLGSALSYHRKEITDTTEYVNENVGSIVNKNFPIVRGTMRTGGIANSFIKSENGVTWYEAVRNCKTNHSQHTAACYEYVWYQDEDCEIEVDGIVKAFVNTKVKDVSEKMQSVTLGEMGIGGNNILDALQDTPINQIGDGINNLKMAVVLGYEKKYTCEQNHTHTDECDYVWVAECNHDHETATDHRVSDHLEINGKTYYQAKGLNAKIADKTVQDMTGDTLTDIALGLTIGDLIDSGMISLGETIEQQEENSYKLALIFSEGNHYFTETVLSQSTNFYCNLTDYAKYSATKPSTTTKTYWNKCHASAGLTDEQLKAHAETWKDLTLKVFVTELLNVL